MGFIELDADDVVRHRIVASIIEAYRRYEEGAKGRMRLASRTLAVAIRPVVLAADRGGFVALVLVAGQGDGAGAVTLSEGEAGPADVHRHR